MAERRIINGYVVERAPDGTLTTIGPASQQSQMPADPTFPTKGPKAQADLTGSQLDNQATAATLPYAAPKAQGDALAAQRQAATAGLPEGFMWSPNGKQAVPIPGYTRQGLSPEIRAKALGQWAGADQLDAIVKDLEEKFNAGPGATEGLRGLGDYLPTEANQRFDRAAQAARGQVKSALGLTGGELNTATEAQQALGPYIGQSSDRDATIMDSIQRLRDISASARRQATATLGGVPDANGRVSPLTETTGEIKAAPTNNASGISQEDLDLARRANALYRGGGTLDDLIALTVSAGRRVDEAKRREFEDAIKSRDSGKGFSQFVPPETERSAVEQGMGALINNPAFSTVAGATNALFAGSLEAAYPEQYAALKDQGGWTGGMMTGGEILGSVGATSGIGAASGAIAKRIAPRLLQGGRVAQFGRNLAADAAYSGIYGGITDGDPLTSAAIGSGGSAAGQLVGKGIGRTLSGFARSPEAALANQMGMRTTFGQDMGGFTKSVEDAATSMPGVGELVSANRGRGFRDFNRAMFDKAGEPIQASVSQIGEAGLDDLRQHISGAYDNATAGVRVPLDPQFKADMQAVTRAQRALPEDYAMRLDVVGQNRVAPIVDAGEMTGDVYQQAMRGLKGSRASAGQAAPGFEQEYRDALTLAMDALRGNMTRNGGQSVVDGLSRADTAYRNSKILEKAVQAAKNGTGTGEIQMFTPAQANTAATQSANKFGGPRPFADLIDVAQKVLPNRVPDSGTGRRVAQMAALGTLGAGGLGVAGGMAGAGDPQSLGLGSFTAAAALALASTKGGQKVLKKALIERPAPIKALGSRVRRRSGLLGSATLPLALTD